MRAAAERHPGEAMAAALRLVGEAQGIECFGIGPDLRHVVGEQRIDADHGAGRDRVALEGEIADRAARHRGHRRLQPHRFLERHLGQRHGFEIVERRRLRRPRCRGRRLRRAACAAIPDGRRARPTNEVSDEVSVSCAAIIRKLMWSTMSCVDSSAPSSWVALAQLREQVFAALGAADRNLLGEIGDDALAAPDAARHLRCRAAACGSRRPRPPPCRRRRA